MYNIYYTRNKAVKPNILDGSYLTEEAAKKAVEHGMGKDGWAAWRMENTKFAPSMLKMLDK